MLELAKHQKEAGTEEGEEEERYFSASEILSWEKKSSKANGKKIVCPYRSTSKVTLSIGLLYLKF